MADITYPNGCRPLSEDLGTDELIRRLKTLTHTLQGMSQEEGSSPQYIPLALHLIDESFLDHANRDVQLLVACCIADILRVYAPEAPYKDQDQIKTIFLHFIKQLHGLKDPRDPSFKRYFYLLENLAFVKSFNMCFELEDSNEIFKQLFAMMFKIVNEDQSSKVKHFMIDILSPLVSEADNFPTELLDMILINIVEPNKSRNKSAFQLAEQLIRRTSDALEGIIKNFFEQVLVMDKVDMRYAISQKVYDLLYELGQLCPGILCSTLPQLECKLKSTHSTERLKAVSLLARMFSEKNSELSKKHPTLLRMLLGRFCDISVPVRVKCVQSSMHFLLHQPHLHKDIVECLRARQHDSDENVRYEVVLAIVATAKRQFNIVGESDELLQVVRERTLDKKFKIRKEALNGLGFVYKQAICEPNNLSVERKKAVGWIKNKVLYGYYMPGVEDRLLIERLLITCLVPYKLPALERMKKLYLLLATLDDNATKAFVELQKNQMKTRKTVSDWIKLHQPREMTNKLQNQLNIKQQFISKLLPEPIKAMEFLTKFSVNMRKDAPLLRCMEIILKRDVSCTECADTMSTLLKKLGPPIMTNLYYHTVKMLVERIASVMVDSKAIGVLIRLIEDCMQQVAVVEEIGLSKQEAGERGLRLLSVLAYVFPAHFYTDTTLRHMVSLLSFEEDYAASLILKSFTYLGRHRTLKSAYPDILDELAPVCKDFALSGTPKQAKHAVRCIYVNTQNEANDGFATAQEVHPVFVEIIEALRVTLSPNCEYKRTKVVTLGQIAYNMPKAFLSPVKNMIARRIVKELLIQAVPEEREEELPEGSWCAEEDLPTDTLCKLDALKTMARWLLGLKDDEHSAQKTFRMLHAFVKQRGDLLEQNRLCEAEKSWLRLGAACAMLKVCEQKGVGDQYSAEQYFELSQLLCDPVPEVREMFVRKLHKGLGKGLPSKCLPLDFMGFYALAGFETDKKISETIKNFVEGDVLRRREYLKTLAATKLESRDLPADTQTSHILPDYMLAFAIPVLVHSPQFTNHEDRKQLHAVEKCLRFIIDPLMAKTESFCIGFYKDLISKIKNHHDSNQDANDDTSNTYNLKMWAACDLAMYIINSSKTLIDGGVSFAPKIELPGMFYKAVGNNFQNTKVYIPLDTYSLGCAPPHTNITISMAKKPNHHALAPTTSVTARQALEKRNSGHITLHENSPTRAEKNSLFDDLHADTITEPVAKRTRTIIHEQE